MYKSEVPAQLNIMRQASIVVTSVLLLVLLSASTVTKGLAGVAI